jgi:hypothetical protein
VAVKKPMPHDFVLEQLDSLSPYTKPMFGCTGVYVGDKIVVILREKTDFVVDNGVWLATIGECHESLRGEFSSMRSIEMFGPGPTGWQVLPSDSVDFEADALRACELILAGDVRIGKIPKSRLPKKKAVAKVKPATKNKSRAKKVLRKKK